MARSLSSLPPSIESRLAGWEKIQQRLAHAREARIRPTITLSRQFGCEGFPLAEFLKERFEEASGEPWNIYDKSLIEKVAQDEDIALGLLKNLGDMTRALEALGLYPSTHVTHDAAFEKVAKAIVQIAAVGNAVIVGRGGAILCRDMRNCFHFRLEATLEWRIASIVKRMDLGQKEAEEMVKSNTKLREKFVSSCLGQTVSDLKHYDAIFNNERHDIQEIGFAIFAYVQRAWPEKGYFKP